ncbi:MAG: HEAT repeat domain-containing protein [Magnetococcales bacterium]|nr:HEAT repeat domain-containing protein [Magnetococcales bacterium]
MKPWNMRWLLVLLGVLLTVPTLIWLAQDAQHAPTAPPTSATPGTGQSATTDLADTDLAQPPAQPSVRLRFSPDEGQIAAWRLDVHSKATIDFSFMQPRLAGASTPPLSSGQGGVAPVESHFSGELYLKFYPRDAGIWNVAGLIQGVDYRMNGEKPVITPALGEPFTFTMTSQGSLQSFHFTRGIPEQASQLIKNSLLGLQTILPKEAQNSWSTTEKDMTGRYRATYHIQKVAAKEPRIIIGKKKRAYLALNNTFSSALTNPAIANSTIHLSATSGTITMAMQGPWLHNLEYKEKLSMVAGTYEWSTAESTTTLAWIERNAEDLFPSTFAEYMARLQSDRYLAIKYYITDLALDRLGAGLNTEDAVELFKKMRTEKESTAKRNAEKFLVNYLRKHPGACVELINLMDQDPNRERNDQETQLVFWRLLTQTGHPEAQQAVLNAIGDASRAEVTQMRALVNIHAFENPQPFLVDELYRYYQQPPAPTDGARDPQKRQMALLALGALGYKEKLNEETKTKVGQLLQSHIGTTQTIPKQMDVLNAIGNYGGKELAPVITPYLTSQDAHVRASAFSSMRRMDDPAVLETLTHHYANEESAKVRTIALQSLAEFTPTQEGMNWANRNALTARHPDEQVILVDLLGTHMQRFPENRQAIQELLKTNPDKAVKRTIYKYIVPGQ